MWLSGEGDLGLRDRGSGERHDEHRHLVSSDDVDALVERLLELMSLPAPPRPATIDITEQLRRALAAGERGSGERLGEAVVPQLARAPGRSCDPDWPDEGWARICEDDRLLALVFRFLPLAIGLAGSRRELEALGLAVVEVSSFSDELSTDPETLCTAFPELRETVGSAIDPARFTGDALWFHTV